MSVKTRLALLALASAFVLFALGAGIRIRAAAAGPDVATAAIALREALDIEVRWRPERPVQGRLFVVEVGVGEGPAPRLSARFAGEQLHFQPREGGGFWAVAAVPVDAEGEMALEVQAIGPEGFAERFEHAVPIAAGEYRMERLTVAPQYGAPLSPELQRRTAAESERAFGVARGAHTTPRLWDVGELTRPRSTRVTSGFGNGREFNGQVESRHMGTDLEGAVGAPVLAPARGVVALVDQFYLGGNVVYLDHGGGLSSGYLHLSEAVVAVGDTVEAGQRIGSVGATGRVTGPHLHWLVRYGGITVDPLSLLELELP
jgi:murein DD-endopeptidase MepM/ murein hydrolase activator NlpD